MKNKGFTLIELLISIMIIVIFTTISLTGHKYLTTMKEKNLLDNTRIGCKDFISISKGFCKENNSTGYILFDWDGNEFKFYNGIYCIDKFKVPNDIMVSEISFKDNSIEIDNTGYIKNAGTICFYNKAGEDAKLSVAVYTNYVKEI